jgi:hypothetical protein
MTTGKLPSEGVSGRRDPSEVVHTASQDFVAWFSERDRPSVLGSSDLQRVRPESKRIANGKINNNNEIRPRLTTFIAVCSWNFGG